MDAALGVVVVNYASSALLRANLSETVREVEPALVVVVDNLSSWSERIAVRALAAEHGWEIVEAETNLGFGGGVNAGAERALSLGAQDLLLLNPDATISAEAVRALQRRATSSRMTAFAPTILDGAGKIWFDGADVYLSDGRTMGVRRRSSRQDEARWEWLSGACLLIPDMLWRATGGFDHDYFLYWEDVDFSRRVIDVGGDLVVVSEAIAVHDEGGTQGRDPSDRAKSEGYYYYNIRNRLMFAAKHLDDEDVHRWRRGAWASAREVLLRGGRRQFLSKPWIPLGAAFRGVRDGRRISRRSSRAFTARPATQSGAPGVQCEETSGGQGES